MFALLALIAHSKPLQGECLNDLKSHYLVFIIDMLVRTRVIEAWQASTCKNALLKDICRNYDKQSLIVQLCALPTARERAQHFLNKAFQSQYSNVVEALNYKAYEAILEQHTREIDNEKYYTFTPQFLNALVTMEGYSKLKNTLHTLQ